MSKIVTRTCFECKEDIHVEVGNVKDIVCYKNKYYHKNCFEKEAIRKSQKTGQVGKTWKAVLENMAEYEREAMERINSCKPSDKLNDWILDHYDITATTTYTTFWRTVTELEQGKYRNKKCKKVPTRLLYEAWVWGQPNLDKINARNKTAGKNIEGEARLSYDLTIILKHIPDYIRFTTRSKEEKKEIATRIEKASKINYEKIVVQPKKEEKSNNDILSLMDEIF